MNRRESLRKKSNNRCNSNKNICCLAVARVFGVADETRYLHLVNDIVYALRKRYTVRSRLSHVRGLSIGGARKKLYKLAEALETDGYRVKGYYVGIDKHALALKPTGETAVDTDPRKRDKRKIKWCYIVYH